MAGGFLEVLPGHVRVLADVAERNRPSSHPCRTAEVGSVPAVFNLHSNALFSSFPVDRRTPDDRWIDLVSLLAYSLLDHVRIEVFRCAVVAFANEDSGYMPRADVRASSYSTPRSTPRIWGVISNQTRGTTIASGNRPSFSPPAKLRRNRNNRSGDMILAVA